MKKLMFVLVTSVLFSSCHTDTRNDVEVDDKKKPDTAQLEIAKEDNLIPDGRKVPLFSNGKRKPVPQPTPTPTSTSTTTTAIGQAVLYVDFDGEIVKHPSWNGGVQITCAPSNLLLDQQLQCLYRLQEAYAPYNVIVTNDRSLYDASSNRQMMIVTSSSAWYPTLSYSGVTYIGSLGSNTPGFVFSDRLNYSTQYVGSILIHESGHAFDLRHQSDFTTSCGVVSTYKMGDNMGNNLYVYQGTWDVQQCSQDDKAVLQSRLGLRQ